jgi:putative transposase
MASKNTIKPNVKDGHYHIYNRGVNKRSIFKGDEDYKVFLKYLKESLSPLESPDSKKKSFKIKETEYKGVPRRPKNFHGKIDLIAYCLMPNHFHFIIKQVENNAMQEFLHSLLVRYSGYFNKKYKRVGPLFQGRYKAVIVNSDPYLLHLSRYIHLNPSEHTKDLSTSYSSYADYLKIRNTEWIKPEIILKFFRESTIPEFKKISSYKHFVEKFEKDSTEVLGKLILE